MTSIRYQLAFACLALVALFALSSGVRADDAGAYQIDSSSECGKKFNNAACKSYCEKSYDDCEYKSGSWSNQYLVVTCVSTATSSTTAKTCVTSSGWLQTLFWWGLFLFFLLVVVAVIAGIVFFVVRRNRQSASYAPLTG
eukprot:TRINITY_DN3070_c0_g2_i1.p1 TRINITY_DN3070_c0_g2~~TRINITY_DN3070_c0_g2_i1.p1  ORF type:complete len:161 (+),score=18.73 TRINITY_DN3070_c0_g2_i1:66-485(+)